MTPAAFRSWLEKWENGIAGDGLAAMPFFIDVYDLSSFYPVFCFPLQLPPPGLEPFLNGESRSLRKVPLTTCSTSYLLNAC
jgi:hypothetical protein